MRLQLIRSTVTIGTAVVIAMLWSATRPVVGQTLPPYKAARTADGEPDLNGFWQALNTANWDIEEHQAQIAPHDTLVGAYLAEPPGFGVVEGGAIPYKPEALAKRKLHFENRLKHQPMLYGGATGDEEDLADPEAKCFQGGGLVRATYMPFPFQIIQAKNKILIAYQFGGTAFRVVHVVAGGDLDKAIDDFTLDNDRWLGRSAGRWEGETLVVYTKGPYYRSVWLDRAGNFMSPNARVEERYTAVSPYHLRYEATITDPDTFTRPWKISMPLYRIIQQPNMQLLEFQCIPFVEAFMYESLRNERKKYPEGFEIR
jgi:hypothetical protein